MADSRNFSTHSSRPGQAGAHRSLALLTAVSVWFVSTDLVADVVPDGSTTTVVNVAPNTVPVVDIAAPTAAGVSRNAYSTFDVGTQGVVINNSLSGGASSLAGGISANTNFNTGSSASIILNEVTTTNRSNLLGTTEIFGDNASFILANPNGITCNGCGFIRTDNTGAVANLNEVLLSTAGSSNFSGSNNSLTVDIASIADIIIGPFGMDVSNVDVTTLFTRRLDVDGLISAAGNRLHMQLGTGTLELDDPLPENRTFTATQPGDGAVSVAIDASVAGAMNAGQIFIMATENGVGVTLDNDLVTDIGDVVLTANGDIVYRNIDAATSVDVTTNTPAAILTVKGDTVAGGDIDWNLAGDALIDTTANAAMTATGDINLNCTAGNCTVVSQDSLALIASQVAGDASLSTANGNNLTIDADINLTSDINSGNDLAITSSGQLTAGNIIAANFASLDAAAINVADVDSGNTIDISSSGAVNTANVNAVDAVTINAASINTQAINSGSDVNLLAGAGDIDTGTIIAVNAVNIDTQQFGAGLSTAGINAVALDWRLNGQAQLVGNLSVSGDIDLVCAVAGCGVNANNDLQLTARNLNTQASLSTANNRNLTINANLQSSADISSGNTLRIVASDADIVSSAAISANNNIELVSAAGGDVSITGDITAGSDLVINGAGNYTHSDTGATAVGGDWIIDTHSLTNDGDIVASDLRNSVFRVDEFHNNGLLHSDGALDVHVDQLLDNDGVIASLEGVINIRHSQPGQNVAIIENDGIISALNLSETQQPDSTLIIDPQSLVDSHVVAILAGEQRTAQDLLLSIEDENSQALSQLTANTGVLGTLQIDADTLNNNASAQISATQIALNVASLNNNGGLIVAGENISIIGDNVSNNNSTDAFGVITARNNIDIVLNNQFDNDGVVDALDVLIDAPVQNNNSSALVLDALAGQDLSTASAIDRLLNQAWFQQASAGRYYYEYRQAFDNNPVISSNLSQLTDAFLAASGSNSVLPIVGDDVYLAELIASTIRDQGDLPSVTDDRSALAQLNTLYSNTLAFMDAEQLDFGVMPDEAQRQRIDRPVLVFEQQALANGDSVMAPRLLLPGTQLGDNERTADLLSTRIIAYNQLLLKGERITNSADLISDGNLVIETIDLTQTTTERNWYIDADGEVRYRSAMISAPTIAVSVSGKYVQQGGMLVGEAPLMLAANSIEVDDAVVDTGTAGVQTVQASIESNDSLYLLAQERAKFAANTVLKSNTEIAVEAGDSLQLYGTAETTGALSLLADNIDVGGHNRQAPRASLQAKDSVLLQATHDIDIGYADIRAGSVLDTDSELADETTIAGDVYLLAEIGDIINTAGDIYAANSAYMKAGGSIINRSKQNVVQNANRYRSKRENYSVEVSDDYYDDEYTTEHYTKVTDTRIESQHVKTDVARIVTGQGGLTQVAGGDIVNAGGDVSSRGDIFQQAEGDIRNTQIAQNYTKSSVITKTVTKKKENNLRRAPEYKETDMTVRRDWLGGTEIQTASTHADGNLTQISGKDIINSASRQSAGGDIYQQAEGDVKNISADIATQRKRQRGFFGRARIKGDNQKLYTATTKSGGNLIVNAEGNYTNTGNIRAGENIDISAKDIINTRLMRDAGTDIKFITEQGQGWLRNRKKITATVTTGKKQVLNTGVMSAGGNISLNASNRVIDTAGRYRAGTSGVLKDADGNDIVDANGDPVKGGFYADGKHGIVMKELKWTERDNISKTVTRSDYDNQSEDYYDVTTTTDLGYNTREKTVTGNIGSASHASLISELGDLDLAGTDIKAGQQIALQGRNVNLNAISKKNRQYRQEGRTTTDNHQIRNDVVTLNAQAGISVTTTGNKALGQGNLNTQGAKFNAGSDATDNVVFNISGHTNLDGVNDEDYSYYKHTKKKRFGRRKTTIRENKNVTLNETEINAGGNLLTNVAMDEQGELIGRDSGKVTLEGTRVNVGGNAILYGEDGVNVLSGIEYTYSRNETHKKGFGGFRSSGSTSIKDEARLGHAELNTGGDTVLLSKNDINVVAGKIDANNITADAGFGLTEAERAAAKSEGKASVNIIGEKEVLASFDHKYKRNIKLSLEDNFLSVAEDRHNKNWNTEENVIGSVLKARNDISLKAASDVNIVGSELSAANNIKLKADNDINVEAAKNRAKDKTQDYRERIGIEVDVNSDSVNAFAGREQKTITDASDVSGVQASLLQAGNNVSMQAGGDINQRGSDVTALNDINYTADGAIRLDTATSTEALQHDEAVRRDGVSSSLNYNYEQTREAVRNAGRGDNAVSRASSTLQAVDSVSNFTSGPTANAFAGSTTTSSRETSTTELARGSSVQAGGNITMNAGDDIDIIGSALIANLDINLDGENINIAAAENQYSQSAESHYDQNGIAMSGQKNTASIGLITSFSDQRNASRNASSQSSLLSSGRNTNISAITDIKVAGSDINAENDISLDAGRDVLIQAHATNAGMQSDGKSGGAGAGITATVGAGGAGLGVYVSGNAAKNNLDRTGASYRNSQLAAGNGLSISSGRNTTLKGANAEAEQVALDVGGDFTIASVQDTGSVSGEQKDVSGRVVGGAGGAVSASVGYGETKGSKAWVNQQTTLIARDRMDVKVKGHTQIDGAVLASQSDNMELETNTIGFSDMVDHDKETSSYLNVGISSSDEKTANPLQQQNNRQTGLPVQSGQQPNGGGGTGVTVSGIYSNRDSEQINRATLGQGNVTVHNDVITGENSVASINRDLTRSQEITRDESSDTQIYASDSSIISVVNTGDTLQQWQSQLDDYAKTTAKTYQQLGELGDAETTNGFESIMTSIASGMTTITDKMGSYTLGLAPSAENHGGLAAQIPAIAVGDQLINRVKVPLKFNADTGKMELDMENLVKLKEAEFPEMDEYVFTNGIQNSFEEAARNGAMQTGATEFILAYNPEHGILGDLLESAWDVYVGGTVSTGNARQLNEFYAEGVKNNQSFNIAAHSQGTLLNYRAMDGLDFSKGKTIETGTVLFSGSPVYSDDFFNVVDKSGFVVKDSNDKNNRVIFQINRPIGETSFFGLPLVDAVADSPLFGGNYDYDGTTNGFWGSIMSIPALFSDDSPHSNYLCQGVTCAGGNNEIPLNEFRSGEKYITPTYIEPKTEYK